MAETDRPLRAIGNTPPSQRSTIRAVGRQNGLASLGHGNTVLYQVTPHYAGSRNVPYEIEMAYIAWDKGGRLIGADSDKTSNLIYTKDSGWKNLGGSIHSGTGQDAGQYGD
ncbi:hypothetical protein ACFXKJ_37915 [Kitasatospora indigofera]|uniref:hypothetical protein n=1 Tax=Kitasatospora indigofera TaxID=67307 RepID=UPI00364CE13E